MKQLHRQDAYRQTRVGAVKTMRNTPLPSKATFLSLTVCLCLLETQGIENDVFARLSNITSAFCDLDL